MKILAFSDWRVQDIEQLIDYLRRLEEKPDVIVYAGDDIRRFNRVPYMFLPRNLKIRYRNLLIKKNESLGMLDKKSIEEFIKLSEKKNKSEANKFEKIASYSKYGLCVVAGNDDPSYTKKTINGKNVYDIHDKSIKIDDFAIVGVEGATSKIGSLIYSEREIKRHLKINIDKIDNKQLIIVSHSPPFGILDFAMRFGKEHFGSTSLRDCIEKYPNKIKLVISGHVHRQGGKFENYKDVFVVNCASHDNKGSPGIIAIIDISRDKVKINWESLYDLENVPLVGPKAKGILVENGIRTVKHLAALDNNNNLSKKLRNFALINIYAKAIISNNIVIKKEIKSDFDNIEDYNIYFFDAEYNSSGTKYGPYGIFLLGWMDRNGNVKQLFLDNSKDELKMLKDFNQWVEREKPLFIAYSSRSGDVPQLKNSYARFKLPSKHLENSFFDLYYDLLYTSNQRKQKYFLPVAGSFGLKRVSESLGYQQSDLMISNGFDALIKYEKFLRKKREKTKEKIKNDLLVYNRDDLKRTKFIYDQLKAKS